tara:strand:- start:1735 stop:2529 length:795 start_codon:yes stop_codon:yes gene_type:complete
MKITVFTSDKFRHISLINKISSIASETFAIVETSTQTKNSSSTNFINTNEFKRYFSNVNKSEKKIFGREHHINKNVNLMTINFGDLSKLKKNNLNAALDVNYFIVFGSSYIKGWLAEYLVEKKAINIHMGVSPYYRGTACNFWALYDKNPQYVGSTIHRLSKGLDSGSILYHAIPILTENMNLFDFTMQSVNTAQLSLVELIKNRTIDKFSPIVQDKNLEIRYSRRDDFNYKSLQEYLNLDLKVSDIKEILELETPNLVRPIFI